MYEEFYGLREKPFSVLPDPEFLYWGSTHSMGYAMLEYGVMNRAGFTVITGEIGCGKTTLIRHLLNRLDRQISIGLLSNTLIGEGELMRWVMMAFGKPFDHALNVALVRDFHDFLINEYAQGRRTILIVDEAQNLGLRMLEELRMLSNINADKDQILQIILVGQPQLKTLLRRPELAQFAQRVASDFHLEKLQRSEVYSYIRHRLMRAGSAVPLFSKKAGAIIAEASGGTPRSINMLCDTALVYGFSSGARVISARLVSEVIKDKQKYGLFPLNQPDTPAGASEQHDESRLHGPD